MKIFFGKAVYFFLILIASASFAEAETSTTRSSTPDQLLRTIIAEVRRFDLNHDPVLAGRKGDLDALARLPRLTPEVQRQKELFYRKALKRLEDLDPETLSPKARLNYDVLSYILKDRLSLLPFDEARIPFVNDSGFHTLPLFLARQTHPGNLQEAEAYLHRLRDIPLYFKNNTDMMRRGVETGFTASQTTIEAVLASLESLLDKNNADLFLKPLQALPSSMPEQERARILKQGKQAVREHVLPAYQDLLVYMTEQYKPAARTEAGLSSLSEGKAFYQALVRHYATEKQSPDSVHRLGLEEVRRIRADMEALLVETGFEGSFAEFLQFLRTDPRFYAKTSDELLQKASWISKRIEGQLPRYFSRLPRQPFTIEPVPQALAPNYTTGRYVPGDMHHGEAGTYWVNTYDLKSRPLYELPALTLHEAVPGHHLQGALAQELEDVPEARRELYPHAFGEGWALYAEKLGEEMAIYQNAYERFGRLSYEMWRACRLVADTGLHWKGWTRERAKACFVENTALSLVNIDNELDRYISWPGQALAYKLGEKAILDMRHHAEKALGQDFDLRAFHDALLEAGPLPFSLLKPRMAAWVKAQKKNVKTP